MNTKTWMPLAFALVLGLVAAVVAQRSMRNKNLQASQATLSLAVAKGAIAPGTALSAEDITLVAVPGQTTPAPQTFTSATELLGRVTAAPMVPGQAFVASLLAPKGTAAGLEALVPPGMRAVTVDLSESGSLAGLLMPGSRVDVVTTSVNRDAPDKTITRTILQNLAVAAVGQRLGSAKAEDGKELPVARTVTLLATPRDAQTLDLALTMSRLRLVMRGSGDQTPGDDEGVMLAELRGGSFNEPTPAPTPAVAVTPATQPAVAAVVASVPTTRPGDPFARTSEIPTRVVTVILGSEERHVTFQEPAPVRPSGLGDVNQQPAIPN